MSKQIFIAFSVVLIVLSGCGAISDNGGFGDSEVIVNNLQDDSIEVTLEILSTSGTDSDSEEPLVRETSSLAGGEDYRISRSEFAYSGDVVVEVTVNGNRTERATIRSISPDDSDLIDVNVYDGRINIGEITI